MKYKELKVLWHYLKNYKLSMSIYFFLSILRQLGGLLTPIIFALAIESILTGSFTNFIELTIYYFGLRIFLYNIINLFSNYIYNHLEMNFVNQVSIDLTKKINNLPAEAFEEKNIGELSNRIYSDPVNVISIFSEITNLFSDFIGFILVLFIIIYMSPIIALEVLAFIIVLIIFTYYILPKLEKLEKTNRDNSDTLYSSVVENLTGIREIKALGIKNTINKKINKKINNLALGVNKASNNSSLYWNINGAVYYIFEFIFFTTAAYLFINGNLEFALFMALQSYLWRIDNFISNIGNVSKSYTKVKITLLRIDEIINNRLYKDVPYGTETIKKVKGIIKFNNVNFKYPKDKQNILNNLNLTCEPNKITAIIGKSGNGKTTIFNLLVRFFDSDNGTITLDNIDITKLNESNLRNNISIIRQNPHIFNMSIIDNLRLVKPNATLNEIEAVCKKAYLHEYILSLKDGYNTMIGEGGINLSGGQKQRLAIARTLLLNTKVILFDEATSALDNESQEIIKKTIKNLSKNHTIIVVAHRLSTIIDADKICIIEKGKITDEGSHQELIKSNKTYQNLYKKES